MKSSYQIGNVSFPSRNLEKDLGVLFSNKLDFTEHMDAIIKKANQKLGVIARIFKNKNSMNIIPLYTSLIRPQLEYNSVIWSPITKKYDQRIERIQKKMINLLRDVHLERQSYEDKLKKIKLMSLRARRIQQQLTVMFKMKKGLIGLHFEDFFHPSNCGRTRGNVFKLNIPKSNLRLHKGFFSTACVKHWNNLKSCELNVPNCTSFRKSIMKYFLREKIW